MVIVHGLLAYHANRMASLPNVKMLALSLYNTDVPQVTKSVPAHVETILDFAMVSHNRCFVFIVNVE